MAPPIRFTRKRSIWLGGPRLRPRAVIGASAGAALANGPAVRERSNFRLEKARGRRARRHEATDRSAHAMMVMVHGKVFP
jgi:hypothetical protein